MRIAFVLVAAVVPVFAAACSACTQEPLPPPEFAAADTDTIVFPLVRPLDSGLLVTPALIGSDWYFVELDPFAPRTRIDGDAVAHAEDDERARVELRFGEMTQTVDADLFDARSIPRDGMDVMGVIGRDVLRDDYVFGVERDAGIAWLAKPSAFHPVDGVKPATFLYGGGDGAAYTSALIGNARHFMKIDFGSPADRVRRGSWLDDPDAGAAADLEPEPSEAAIPLDVHAFGAVAGSDALLDYHGHDADGVLGEPFFARYDLALDRKSRSLYLSPRRAVKTDARVRVSRWGTPRCAHLGCVGVAVEPPGDGAQPRVNVTREPAAAKMPLEVALVAIDAPALPRVRVGMPADVHAVHLPIDARYTGHTLAVTDIGPLPEICASADESACTYLELAR